MVIQQVESFHRLERRLAPPLPEIRRRVASLGPQQPVFDAKMLDDRLNEGFAPLQIMSEMLDWFGFLVLTLAAGSGSTTVNGRLVTGMQGDNVTYAPRNERCEVGTYAPASAGAEPAPSAPAAPTTGGARLTVSSAFPAGANPLAGITIFLYKDSLANVLRKAGASIAPNATAGEALRATVIACKPPADCSAMSAALEPLIASPGRDRQHGSSCLHPAGATRTLLYLSGSARSRDSVLVWDIKVDLKPGDNSVVLDQSNAETVH